MSKKILVADDSLTIQKVIELTFMDESHEVTAVSDGQEAIDRLDGLEPDVVIADVHMPGLGGLDVCRRVKESTPGLPVLLLVGTFEPFEMEEAEQAGADAVLRKPFDSQELMEEVERLLSSAGAEDEAGADAAAAGADAAAAGAAVEGEAEAAVEGEAADDAGEDTAPSGIAAETEVFAMPEAGDQASPSNWGFQQEAEPFRLGETGPVEDQVEEPAPVADPWQELDVAPTSQDDSPQEGEDEATPEVVVAAEAEEAPDEAPDGEAIVEGEAEAAPAVSERAAMAWKPQAVEATAEEDGADDTGAAANGGLSDDDVERIAQRVAEIVGERVAKDVAWEVIPDLAEVIIKDRLRELEDQVD
ncbi:MAG: response regulator [Acidobacteriota bacterium]